MAEAGRPFEPCWLFHATRPPELVENVEMYDALMEQGGWETTPAAHGKITAPNRQQAALTMRELVDDASAVKPVAVPTEVQQRLEALEKDCAWFREQMGLLDTMHELVQQHAAVLGTQQTMVQAHDRALSRVQQRVAAVEEAGPPPKEGRK